MGLDETGNLTATDLAVGGQRWLEWAQSSDVAGKLLGEYTPGGVAFTGTDTADGTGGVGDALGYDRAYSYDGLGQLTSVVDKTAIDHT